MQSISPPVEDTTVHAPNAAFASVTSGHWEIQTSEFVIGKKIGEGANAGIYTCILRGSTTCAAKMLKENVTNMSQAYKDLIMELDILTTVKQHPNLVTFFGACIIDKQQPVVFEELVLGPTLEKFLITRIDSGRRLERRTVYSWCRDLLRALDFLHSRNPIIMHRDLKPANILLTKDLNSLKVADFGMAKKIDRGEREQKIHKGYTGTLRYMAPEVRLVRTGNYTEKVDIYSASLIMWYIAACKRPELNKEISALHLRPDLKAVQWPNMETMLGSMWVHEPEMRPSANDLLRQMSDFADIPADINDLGAAPKTGCVGCVTQ